MWKSICCTINRHHSSLNINTLFNPITARLFSFTSIMDYKKTAAALIIGDEVLSGKTLDTNSNYLAKSLFEIGIELRRIQVIPDEEIEIVDAVRFMSKTYDYVFTSGGIGPTHDDITYPSLARAFNDRLCLNPETLKKMAEVSPNMVTRTPHKSQAFDQETSILVNSNELITANSARLRMVTLPSQSKIVYTPGLWVPLVILNENVHVLPGIPKLFSHMLDHYLSTLNHQGTPFCRRSIGTALPEGDIADHLSEIQAAFESKGIKIGSYPTFGNPDAKKNERVIVTVVGKDVKVIEHVAELVQEKINGWPVSVHKL